MKTTRVTALLAALVLCTQAGAQQPATPPQASPPAAPQSDAEQREQLRREVDEAAREIGAYTAARRDQALARAREAMARMEARIERLRADWARDAQRATAQVTAAHERRMVELEERRNRMQARYRELEAANTQAWVRTSESFLDAYRELARSLGLRRDEPPAARDTAPDEPEEQDEDGGRATR